MIDILCCTIWGKYVQWLLRFLYTQVSLFFASKIEHSESDMMCTICFDDINQIYAYTKLRCGYIFHLPCIIKHLIHETVSIHEIFLRRKLYPNCRAIIIHEDRLNILDLWIEAETCNLAEGSIIMSFLNQKPSWIFLHRFIPIQHHTTLGE